MRDSWHGLHKGLQVCDVAVGQAIVEAKRESRQIVRIVGCDSPTQRSGEIGKLPTADPGLSVWCDIGRDHAAERGLDGAAASIGSAAVLAVCMTLVATGSRGQIGAANCRISRRR